MIYLKEVSKFKGETNVYSVGLANKLREIYPNLGENKLNFSVVFEKDKDAWLITFFKGNLKRYAYLDKRDADCVWKAKNAYI
ncbi:MAG: hypothetical protein C0174_00530 [Thermodesulfobium narugense]|nr:MAG: hypothetical protein C0174_00530 [Thermodesulfobium narugense]